MATTDRARGKFAALFDFAPLGYVMLDKDGTVDELNLAAARILGVDRRGASGSPFARFVMPGQDEAYAELFSPAYAGETSSTSELRLARAGGLPFVARVHAACHDGSARSYLVAFEDVTVEKEREQRTLREESDLREEGRLKDEFIARLSHELRNPLAPIRASLYVLSRSGPHNDETRRAHMVIERQATQLTRLVEDLLDVSRIRKGSAELQREHVDLVEVVRRTVEDERATFESAGIELDLDGGARPLWAHADPARIVQMVSNLLGNSKKFTLPDGRVTVSCCDEAGFAVVRVRDTGIGIPPAALTQVLSPFKEAPRSLDRARGGLGLGLLLVKSFAELHGGHVRVTSDGNGKGTLVEIRLPLESPPVSAERPMATVALKRKILVIEDGQDFADGLKEVLTMSGHEVKVAYNGHSGLELARLFRPEVVICDVGLPGMDGYDVARSFRADAALRGVYLVALTGYARLEDRRRAAAAGFNRHLAKPPDFDALDRLIREVPWTDGGLRAKRAPS